MRSLEVQQLNTVTIVDTSVVCDTVTSSSLKLWPPSWPWMWWLRCGGSAGGRCRVLEGTNLGHYRGALPWVFCHPLKPLPLSCKRGWGHPPPSLEGEQYGPSSGAGLALDWLCCAGSCSNSGWATRLAGGGRMSLARAGASSTMHRGILAQVKKVVSHQF